MLFNYLTKYSLTCEKIDNTSVKSEEVNKTQLIKAKPDV